jgi:hypothetical protein
MTEPTTRQTNPKRTLVIVPANNGAAVLISASKFTKYVEIQECPPEDSVTYAPQGLIYTLPDDGYVYQYPLVPGQIWSAGDNTYRGKLGFAVPAMTDPANNAIPATPYLKAISGTATATQVMVTEWS